MEAFRMVFNIWNVHYRREQWPLSFRGGGTSSHHSNINIRYLTTEKASGECGEGRGARAAGARERGLKGNPHKSLIYGWKWNPWMEIVIKRRHSDLSILRGDWCRPSHAARQEAVLPHYLQLFISKVFFAKKSTN